MGITGSICKLPAIALVLILCGCVGLGTLGMMLSTVPAIGAFLERASGKYDSIFPEITIRAGQASVREKQPYVLDRLREKDLLIMVDTREGKQSEALNHLKEVPSGAVLTRDTLVIKNQGEIRILPLKNMPDMVINSESLQTAVRDYMPTFSHWAAVALLFYFLVVKPAQVLILGTIPYFAAKAYSVSLSYGNALKIASVAMAGPVILDFLLDVSGVRLPGQFVVYFVAYIGILILAARDLVRNSGFSPEPDGVIRPQ